jgi:DNA-binding helix-hairpin-helix protein with protein kinase domain
MNVDDSENKLVSAQSGNLSLGDKIGSGEEGEVYSVRDSEPIAVKIFFPEYRQTKESKIRSMVKESNRPDDLISKGGNRRSIIWPETVIENMATGEFLGYTMPQEDLEGVDTALVGASKLDWVRNSVKGLGIAFNLTIMVKKIHDLGHAVGDFNHKNIIIDDGYIKLIDCDGFDISNNGDTYSANTIGTRYTPPEGRPDNIEAVQKMDRFCLAVHIFQFLMKGNHPFRAIGSDAVGGDCRDKIKQNEFPYINSSQNISPPENLKIEYNHIPADLKKLLVKCFTTGKYENLDVRPTPTDWKNTLEKVLDFDDETNKEDTLKGSYVSNLEVPDTISYCYTCGTDMPEGESIEYCYKCGENLYEDFRKTEFEHCYKCGTELFDGNKISFCHMCGVNTP